MNSFRGVGSVGSLCCFVTTGVIPLQIALRATGTRLRLQGAMASPQLKILYDGECPMCRREMEWLKRRDKHGQLGLEDIAAPGFDPLRYGCTREQVFAGIHAVLP